jgi:alpha-beta hydrolase superfamily lysophospholipase
MTTSEFVHTASDGKAIFVRKWLPTGPARAILLVAHGMAEHSARYERFAAAMTSLGWAVFAPDLRGHGRTAAQGELGWFSEREGFFRVRDDLHEVAQAASADLPGAPLFLFGHSLGSLFAEAYVIAYGRELRGCILSGVLEPLSPLLLGTAKLIAGLGTAFKGQKASAKTLHAMGFGAYNKDFEPARTPLDWLSRDADEVDKYLADPLCGFVCSFGLYRDIFSGFSSIYSKASAFSGLPKPLSLFIAAGAEDPCGGAKGFVLRLADKFKANGLQDVATRLYPGARHEILNETNRDEVVADIKGWLESKLATA